MMRQITRTTIRHIGNTIDAMEAIRARKAWEEHEKQERNRRICEYKETKGLERCPECFGVARRRSGGSWGYDEWHGVRCDDCKHSRSTSGDQDEADNMWNEAARSGMAFP